MIDPAKLHHYMCSGRVTFRRHYSQFSRDLRQMPIIICVYFLHCQTLPGIKENQNAWLLLFILFPGIDSYAPSLRIAALSKDSYLPKISGNRVKLLTQPVVATIILL